MITNYLYLHSIHLYKKPELRSANRIGNIFLFLTTNLFCRNSIRLHLALNGNAPNQIEKRGFRLCFVVFRFSHAFLKFLSRSNSITYGLLPYRFNILAIRHKCRTEIRSARLAIKSHFHKVAAINIRRTLFERLSIFQIEAGESE